MNWINIHTSTISSPEFKGAEDKEQAAWILLLAWCCDQENSGVIKDAKSWKPKKWQTVCGVSSEVVYDESELWHFEGDDLHVHFYPIEHQEKAKTSRENGKRGGRPKKTQQDTQEKPSGIPNPKPKSNPDPNPNIKKDKERELNKMKQVASLVKRRESTKWSDKEIKQFKKVDPSQEDIDFLISKDYSNHQYRRRDLITLLNNWSGELDRMNQPTFSQQQTSTPQTTFRI